METTQKPLVKRGWQRAVIYIVGVALIVIFIQLFSGFFIGELGVDTNNPENSVLSFTLVYSLLAALVFAFTLFMRRLVDRESFESLGFTWTGYSNEAGLGFFTAFAILGIGSLILVAIGYLSFITITFDATRFLMEIVVMIIVAFVEELLFRGYLLHNLMLSLNKWIALVISALLFSAFHSANPDVSVFAIVNIFIAGLLLGINYIFTKNLWFGIFFHFAWNYLQGPVFGYEVSGLKLSSLFQQSLIGPEPWTGGPFGFEGSLLCALLLAIALVIFAYAFTKRYQESPGFDGNINS
jgi:membrane protease YdiL (CAAX protease family)